MPNPLVPQRHDHIAREHWANQARLVRENQSDSHDWARAVLYFDLIKNDLPESVVECAEELCNEPVIESEMLAALLAVRGQCDRGVE